MYVGLGVVKRIKTNVRHLREENEVERNRQRGRESERTVGRAYSPWPARMLKVIVSYLVNMQSVCAGVCVCGRTFSNSFNCFNWIMHQPGSGSVGQVGSKNAATCRCN